MKRMFTFENGIWDSNEVIINKDIKANDTIYSDRLYQWHSQKHDDLCEKYFHNQGQYWDDREPELIQSFLSDYLGHNIILTKITREENASTGYPYWKFDFYWDK